MRRFLLIIFEGLVFWSACAALWFAIMILGAPV